MKKRGFSVWIIAFLLVGTSSYAGSRNKTRYPVVLSHHWSGSAYDSFLGDYTVDGEFEMWGVKHALEDQGAIVYQPDKIPYASHETRGQLLYRKCEGDTLEEQLCEDEDAKTVDGVELAMLDYCGDEEKRGAEYTSYEDCIDRVKINIICHSQGCPDSRYMISAVSNRLSGKPMYEHVASWTSVAGANKGTALADLFLSRFDYCEGPDCRGTVLMEALLALFGIKEDGKWPPGVYESIVALSRKYMTRTMDLDCDTDSDDCAPSFNQAYPNQPTVYYQTYHSHIRWLHPCYADVMEFWPALYLLEGENDGWISVDSQRFVTAGNNPDDPPTYVNDRGDVNGTTRSPLVFHPGISHMGFSSTPVPGMGNVGCGGGRYINRSLYRFSREGFYQDVVEDLKNMGF